LNEEKKEIIAYPVPVTTMLTLKDVTPLMPDETVNVTVAAVYCPAFNVQPSLLQVTVIGPLAPVGLQLAVVMLNVI
jgi:hypothetical protein